MFRLSRLISVPRRLARNYRLGPRFPGISRPALRPRFPGILLHNRVNERTSANPAESGHIAAPPGDFSHDEARGCGDGPVDWDDNAFMMRYYADYKNWHCMGVDLPPVWSSDWERWDDGPHFSGPSGLEGLVAQIYGVSMPMEPMGFFASRSEPIFLFFADGEYYFYNMGSLMRFEERFASYKDFLCRFEMHLHSGVDVQHQQQTYDIDT
ncbi:hypothetical protein K438DRAFT_2063965 [Mycena galopus ATCC 62051]|nr:hypothetical protein K438DRAFT_2063965 [Mycena galopus ATCC 62051]